MKFVRLINSAYIYYSQKAGQKLRLKKKKKKKNADAHAIQTHTKSPLMVLPFLLILSPHLFLISPPHLFSQSVVGHYNVDCPKPWS